MSHPRSSGSGEFFQFASTPTTLDEYGHHAPLVIVSEQGRHSTESRRIVRAQAARASAAQSRVTRARNREGREASDRSSPRSPRTPPSTNTASHISRNRSVIESNGKPVRPLGKWLQLLPPTTPKNTSPKASSISLTPNPYDTGAPTSDGRPQLPVAVPRGFSMLQQRINISSSFMTVLGHASCFDFFSPGIEDRLHHLLIDLILGYSIESITPMSHAGHPIQGFIRVACTALTIFQSQRADGGSPSFQAAYQSGLEASWAEAVALDPGVLMEPNLAEVALWALLVITATAGPTAKFFQSILRSLADDLNCKQWDQARNILVEFLYPSSYLDKPCREVFNLLCV